MQRVEPVSTTDSMPTVDILSVSLLETTSLLTSKVPSRASGTQHGLLYLRDICSIDCL